MHTAWQTTRLIATKLKIGILTATLATASLLLMLATPGIAHAAGGINDTRSDAWGTTEVADGGWLNGAGVYIKSNGPLGPAGPDNAPTNYINNVNGDSTQTGIEWQCVEMINRLYLTYGWTTSWWGGYGYQIYTNTPSGLTKQLNGSITNLSAGDVIAFSGGSDGFGHVGIVDHISGSTVTMASQNTSAVYDSSFTISGGTLSTTGWSAYTIQGVIHAPAPSIGSWWSRFNGVSGSKTRTAVTVKSNGTHQDMWAVSNAGDLMQKSWSSASGWTAWVDRGAPSGVTLSAINVLLNPNEDYDIYGIGSDGHLWQKSWHASSGWSGWADRSQPTSVSLTGMNVIINPDNNNEYIFAVGSDHHLWQKDYTGSWSGWTDRGVPSSNLTGSPSTIMNTNYSLDIYATSANGHLWQKSYNGSWTGWTDRGVPSSVLTSSPYTVLSSNGNEDIYGIGSDGHLWQKSWASGSGWTGWVDRGAPTSGTFIGTPSISLSSTNHQDIYMTSSAGHLWQKSWDPSTGWTSWVDRGAPTNTIVDAPNAVLSPNSNQDIYGVGTDGHMWQISWTSSGGWTSWVDRGAF